MSDDAPLALDPDEPRTPAWFSFFGLGLFLLAGIFFLVKSGDDEGEGPAAQDGSAAEGNPTASEGDEPTSAD